jgi:C_GCAxxG_C_C family probable redox protein
MNQEELLTKLEGIHQQYSNDKLNCAERTFLAIHGIVQTDIPGHAVSMLTGFGGGIGGSHQSVCGAVTGSIAALNLVWGRRQPASESSKPAYAIASEFLNQFKSRFGTEICGELIGDLLRVNQFQSEERKARCYQYCDNAIKMCVDLLKQHEIL